jgi:hypothetical protein
MKKFLAAAMLLTVSAISASAAMIPDFQSADPSAGGTTFIYLVNLAESSEVDTTESEDQLLVIYDFAGFTGTWSSVKYQLLGSPTSGLGGLTGPTPEFPATETFDDPAVTNLVFRYIGPFQNTPGMIDVIEVESIYSNITVDRFRGQGTKFVPGDPSDQMSQGTSGFVEVPAIPEPATMGLLGSALLGFALLARRRSA